MNDIQKNPIVEELTLAVIRYRRIFYKRVIIDRFLSELNYMDGDYINSFNDEEMAEDVKVARRHLDRISRRMDKIELNALYKIDELELEITNAIQNKQKTDGETL